MLLFELFDKTLSGYQDEANDSSQMELGQSRKTILTLAHINKMRRMSELRQYEMKAKVEAIRRQYKSAQR